MRDPAAAVQQVVVPVGGPDRGADDDSAECGNEWGLRSGSSMNSLRRRCTGAL
jgi:hypothetical protein